MRCHGENAKVPSYVVLRFVETCPCKLQPDGRPTESEQGMTIPRVPASERKLVDHSRARSWPVFRHLALAAYLDTSTCAAGLATPKPCWQACKLRCYCHLCLRRLTPFGSVGYLQHRLWGLPGLSLSLALARPLPTRAIINVCITAIS